jgi:glycosyltransferase involved in cell wall biosynthesis
MMAELYSLAGAVFLPSESEGFGLPVVEAGLHRVPVVASDLAVFREVAGDLIRRYPVGDVEAATAALSAALAGSEAKLQAQVRGGYTWSALFPKIEAVIARALD